MGRIAANSQERIADAIGAIVGPGGLIRDVGADSRYGRDWSGDNVGTPMLVVRPRTADEVSQVVALCALQQVRVAVQGGHTGLVGGGVPSPDGDEIVLSLERMNAIHGIDEANFSMTVEAGCILEIVRAEAAGRGLCFPLALGSQGSCQIGGAIATNAGGLNVLRYGMMRDLVLGIEVVLPDGRIWNGLKALRKDNTGYDFKQLMLGSEGTLGVITAAILRLFPNPTQTETAFLSLASTDAVVSLYAEARRDLSDLLSAFELLTQEGVNISGHRNPVQEAAPVYVLLEAAASGFVDLRSMVERFLESALAREAILDGALASSTAQANAFWQIREAIIEAQLRRGRHLRTDISVPISAIPRFMELANAAMSALSESTIVLAYGHVGDGNLHFNVIPPASLGEDDKIAFLRTCEDAIFAVVDALDGSISAEHGIGRIKRAAFLRRITPVHADMLKAVRDAFNPLDILNSGRLLEPGRR